MVNSSSSLIKSKLPLTILIMGIVGLLFPLLTLFTIIPGAVALVSNTTNNPFSFVLFTPFGMLIGAFLSLVLYGLLIVSRQKKFGGITKDERTAVLIMFYIGIIAYIATIPTIITQVIDPIYDIASSF